MSDQRFNTGNPIGSNSPLDRSDNTRNLDLAVNSDGDTFQDRMGKSRLTWAGIVKAGSGDPAIAVDAAARAEASASTAEAAADNVEQNAEQIAQDAAQQAVDNIVTSVDGAVDRAEGAADRAEAAAYAAFINADVYPDVASGLAAVAEGEQFQVLSADGLEYVRYRHDAGGVATELPGKYPSAKSVADLEERTTLSAEQPNLFKEGEILFTDSTGFTNSATVSASRILGAGAWKITAAAGVNQSAIRTFSVSDISGSEVSASVLVQRLDEGVDPRSCFVDIRQHRVGGDEISGTAVSQSVAAAAGLVEPVRLKFAGIPVHAEADTITMRFFVYALGMSTSRSMWVRDLLFAAGQLPIFSQPPARALIDAEAREERIKTTLSMPNLFSAGEVAIEDSSPWEGLASMTASKDSGREAWQITSAPGLGQSKYRYFSRSLIGSANAVSMSLLVTSLEPGIYASSCFIRLRQFDSSGAEIPGTALTQSIAAAEGKATPTEVVFRSVPVHASTTSFQVYAHVWANGMSTSRSMWIRDLLFAAGDSPLYINPPMISAGSGSSIIYVGGAGASDLNNGTSSSPFATPGAAIAHAASQGVSASIRFQGEGDYPATGVTMSGLDRLEMRTETGARVRLLGSSPLQGITKTPGFSKVYQVPLASAPAGRYVWQHDTPDESTVIVPSLRHSLHRGMRTRLPHTRLMQSASVEGIDSADLPTWYWAEGTLYFSVSSGSDGLEAAMFVPGAGLPFSGGNGKGLLMLDGITSLYSSRNFRATNLARVELVNCRSYGSGHDGFSYDDTRTVIAERCISGGASNDGFNQHTYSTALGQLYSSIQQRDCWAHDTGDDGDSIHEFCEGSYWGGLYEYCGDRGVATAAGAHTSHYNSIARYCGQDDLADNGAGFCVTNPVKDTGLGTSMDLHGCISIGNKINFSAVSDGSSSMTLYGGVSSDAVDYDFEARANTVMNLIGDVRVIGPAQRVLTSSGGSVVVRQGVPVA